MERRVTTPQLGMAPGAETHRTAARARAGPTKIRLEKVKATVGKGRGTKEEAMRTGKDKAAGRSNTRRVSKVAISFLQKFYGTVLGKVVPALFRMT